MRRGVLAALVLIPSVTGCGDRSFTAAERAAVREACQEQNADAAPGDRYCDCAVEALKDANADEFRKDRVAFLREHLDERTIARCS